LEKGSPVFLWVLIDVSGVMNPFLEKKAETEEKNAIELNALIVPL
jgi:hypothetical protein